MNTQIDLSKAYIGQYITLANGKRYRIGNIHTTGLSFIISSYCNELLESYNLYGKHKLGESDFDIVAVEDNPEIKLLKNYAQIEALEWALKYISAPSERGKLCAKIDELRFTNIELTVNSNESN